MKKVKSTALVIVLCLAVAAVCLSVRTETSPRKIVSAAVYARMGQTVIWTHCFRERMKKCTKISKK